MVNKVILIGNVGIDPEIRTTEGGVKVARIRLATTERLFDRQANEWTDGDTMYLDASAWRGMAENVAETLVRDGEAVWRHLPELGMETSFKAFGDLYRGPTGIESGECWP